MKRKKEQGAKTKEARMAAGFSSLNIRDDHSREV